MGSGTITLYTKMSPFNCGPKVVCVTLKKDKKAAERFVKLADQFMIQKYYNFVTKSPQFAGFVFV